MREDDLEPRLGKIRNRASKTGKRYAHQVLAETNTADICVKNHSNVSFSF